MPCVEAGDGEPATPQLVYQPWRHRTGLDTNAGVLSTMPLHRTLDLFRIGGALPRHNLRPVSSTTQIAVNFCETSKPT